MNDEQCKMRKCRYYFPTFTKGLNKCVYGAKKIGDYDKFAKPTTKEKCENCENYKCKYIEYPIVINGIEYGNIEPRNVNLSLVKVRLCDDDITYLGVCLGEFPHFPNTSYNEESGVIKFGVACNPCIYIPKLKKVTWGSQSWWCKIESEEELKEITDEDIENVWYVKMLKFISEIKADKVAREFDNGVVVEKPKNER